MAFNISYIFEAVDKFSATSRRITERMNEQARKVNKANDAIRKQREEYDKLAKKARNTGAVLTAAITVPVLMMGKRFVDAASDAEETRTKFETTFKAVRMEAIQTGKTFAKEFGVAESTSQKLLSSTGDLLTGFGFTGDMALDLSLKVNRLAADLASFQNLEGGTARASEALTKALLGETESAKSLGIVIRQNSPEFKGLIAHFQKTKGLTETQAKAFAAFTIAATQSKNAIGDVARTWDSYANSSRRLDEQQKALAETWGKLIMPFASMLNSLLSKLLGWLQSLSPTTQKLIIGFIAFAAVMAPIIALVGVFMLALPGLIALAGALGTAFAFAGAAILFALSPVGLAIMAIIAAIWLLKSNWIAVSDAIGGTIEQIKINFQQFLIENPIIGKAFDFVFGGSEAQADINVNINDRGGNVGSVESSTSGSGVNLNVGHNMGG